MEAIEMNNPSRQTAPGLLMMLQALDLDANQEELWGCAIDATYNEYSVLRALKRTLPEGDSFQMAIDRAQSTWSKFYASLTASQRSLITGAMHIYRCLAASGRPFHAAI